MYFYAMQFIQGETLGRTWRPPRLSQQRQPGQKPSEGSIVHGLLSGRFHRIAGRPGPTREQRPDRRCRSPGPPLCPQVVATLATICSVARVGLQVADVLATGAHCSGSAAL